MTTSTELRCSKCSCLLVTIPDGKLEFDKCQWPYGIRRFVLKDGKTGTYEIQCPKCLHLEEWKIGYMVGWSRIGAYAGSHLMSGRDYNASARRVKWPHFEVRPPTAGEETRPPEILECARAFESNIAQVAAIGEMPELTLGLSGIHKGCSDQMRHAHQQGKKIGKDFENAYSRDAEVFTDPLGSELRESAMIRGFEDLWTWAELHPEVALALKAIRAAQISLAWTAFETLAGDLWERLLNLRPRLGFMALEAWPVSDDRLEIQRKKEARIEIPRWLLEEPNFMALQCLGTVARQQSQWGFQKLNNIISAYSLVFKKDKAVMAILQDDRLRVMSAIRNVLVHKAGRADKPFIDQVQADPELRAIERGAEVPITNDRTTKLVEAVCHNGQKLITFASDWLNSNPT